MNPAEARLNDFIEGFGLLSEGGITIDHAKLDGSAALKAGRYVTVGFTPFVGLFRQSKYSPIRYCPTQLELELVHLPHEAVKGNLPAPAAAIVSESFF